MSAVSAEAAWAGLSEPWRVCLEEAWASWRAGSAGVGAVIVDGDDRIVARGRNRRHDERVGGVSLAGTRLAHAEMCALVALPPGPYERYTLYTSFEPCLMCASAILVAHIPRVCYAAPDPFFAGMHDWFGTFEFSAERRPEQLCLGGPIGVFAHVLHLSWLAFWFPEGLSVGAHGSAAPDHLALAADLVERSSLPGLAADGRPVVDAIAALWDDLVALG